MEGAGQIDLVYCFVDGGDPVHRAAREQAWAAAQVAGRKGLVNRPGHYEQVGELTFSVRSALRHMPWIRQVVIVTDGMAAPVDPGLLAAGRVRIVRHADFIPPCYLPVFSAPIIESFLHRIPGLSEIWLYQNDDFFLGGDVSPGDFVTPGGQIVGRCYPSLIRHVLRRGCEAGVAPHGYCNSYTFGISNAALLLSRQAQLRMRDLRTPRHFTQAYRRSTGLRVEELLADALDDFRQLRFRSYTQLSFSTLATSIEYATHGLASPGIGAWRDHAFFDFDDAHSLAARARMWRKVRDSKARFLCLNNIQQAEKGSFEQAMAARGLGGPLT